VFTPLEASGLIDRTGGKSLYATESDFEPLFAALAEELTGSYAVAFYPSDHGGERTFRKVTIESRDGYNIRQNRPGYGPK
jgi:hypothetical protein